MSTMVDRHRPRGRLQTALLAIAVLLLAMILVDRIFFASSTHSGGTGSGHAATQSRTVPPFTAVDLAGANNVIVRVGAKRSVVVHADDNLLGRVTTRVRSGTLEIATTPGNLNAKTPMYVTVAVPTLDALRITGAGNVSATGIDSPKLTVSLPGSGNIDAKGTAKTLAVSVGGAGMVVLRGLTARDATATLGGNGTIMLTATRSLTAKVTGTGTIFYGGSPQHVTQAVTGTGTISPG